MFTKNLLESVNALVNPTILQEGKKDSINQLNALFKKIGLDSPQEQKPFLDMAETVHQRFKRQDQIQFLINKIKDLVLTRNKNQPKFEPVSLNELNRFIELLTHVQAFQPLVQQIESQYKFPSNGKLKDVHDKVQEFLTIWEEEQNAEQERHGAALIPLYDEDKVILKYPDGHVWVLRNKSHCREEGDAAGHCGNSAGYEYGERILSFRKEVKEDGEVKHYPELFFVLDENGLLGEMKGRKNSKPGKRHKRYIIDLLKQPIVKGLKGGGYKPEANFSLSDLNINEIEDVLATNKNFELSYSEKIKLEYKKNGVTQVIKDELPKFFEKVCGFTPIEDFIDKNGNVLLWTWDNIEDYVQTFYESTSTIQQYFIYNDIERVIYIDDYAVDELLSDHDLNEDDFEDDPDAWEEIRTAANDAVRFAYEDSFLDELKHKVESDASDVEFDSEDFEMNSLYIEYTKDGSLFNMKFFLYAKLHDIIENLKNIEEYMTETPAYWLKYHQDFDKLELYPKNIEKHFAEEIENHDITDIKI